MNTIHWNKCKSSKKYWTSTIYRGESLSQLWVFILAPILGAVLAALFYRFVIAKAEETSDISDNLQELAEQEVAEKAEEKDSKKNTKTTKKSK